MYLDHYGLKELPFGITPDTSFAFDCTSQQEALNTLLVAVMGGEGFVKITGEVGTGKTLLCRRFLSSLGESYVTAYLPNPALDPRSLLLSLADELDIPLDPQISQHQLVKNLALALLGFARKGKRVVACLDEAQAMPLEALETLRLLSNLETEKRKLLQVLLFGQPELDKNLSRQSARQLLQRITFQYRLGSLSRGEMEYYLAHRLRVAGLAGGQLFSRGALRAMFRASRGVPRLINVLAHKSLLLVYGEGGQQALSRHVRAAAADTPACRRGVGSWLGGERS